ncbi:MAG TPA: thiopurine S-methyltransferase [Dokdonella sp.]|uniref:thiopurine S-methyltransferase n=1 Tax=Dokdonella sp. TaxID=2291710 RepID=UPI002D7F1419|nr:thiopurine S-methyltransferase [Dokdonella sp.]HET9033641.1 thiopurine S-methyltransferase [Dokdonella sp.]
MQAQFWLQRWQQGQTGFHRDEVMPLLEKHWPALSVPAGSRVFVPLAGKSKDMLWLVSQGYRVLGVELSPLAVEQFFDENKLEPAIHDSAQGKHFIAGDIELICGDMFDLGVKDLSDCVAIYDRAALIALPLDLRKRYASHLSRTLPAHCRMLLIALDYAQSQMDGPPFSVSAEEVQALYANHWQISMLERRDILSDEPRFIERGLTALHTSVFQLRRLG